MTERGGDRGWARLVAPEVAPPSPEPVDRAARWSGPAAALFTPGASTGVEGAGPAAARSAGLPWAPVQVLGGPGTGKTSLIVDLVCDRLARGVVDPESVLVLTQSRRAARHVRSAITTELLAGAGGGRGAMREPLVRTVHSYAFAVLRLQAALHDEPPPRLITGAEQDAVLRELLRGEAEDGGAQWPAELREALRLSGFARELRSLMLRAAERGVGPRDLVRLGSAHGRPEWRAAGRFAERYEQVMLLRASVGMEAPHATAPALDAAGLIGAALTALESDRELYERETGRIRMLLVDDAQHLDPQAAQLVRRLGAAADLAVVAGDPDQSVYGFRGADPEFVAELAQPGQARRVVLRTSRRSSAPIICAVNRVAGRLSRSAPQRGLRVGREAPGGDVRVAVLGSAAKEAAVVADTLRRAHLVDGVPWSQMAVIVRSVPLSLAPLRRALLAAGVPVQVSSSDAPLARRHGPAALLLALRAVTADGFTVDDALALLAGPLGGADPVRLRRLRRGLRRAELAAGGERDSAVLLREILLGTADSEAARLLGELSDVEAEPVRRVLRVLERGRKAAQQGRSVEEVLWAIWHAAGLQPRWVTAAIRGGSAGAQADRDLDAVVALFDAAADYTDRLPAARLSGFVEYIVEQEIPGELRSAGEQGGDAVALLSAHAAAGREWEVVAVAGVQEGVWPRLGHRSGVLGTDELVDAIEGRLAPGGTEPASVLSRSAPVLDEERRLFFLACSRARARLLVTAVEAEGDQIATPSRFLEGLAPGGGVIRDGRIPGLEYESETDADGDLAENPGTQEDSEPGSLPSREDEVGRVLALPALVAELRSVVATDPGADEVACERRCRAARQLARLAAAGVSGAHPDDWYGLAGPSVEAALWNPQDGPVTLTPSSVEKLQNCALRWLLERCGGEDGQSTPAIMGTLVHTLVQAVAGDLPDEQVRAALARAWAEVDLGSPWYSQHELDRTAQMLRTFRNWLRETRNELTQVGVEVAVDGVLPPPDGEGDEVPAVRIRGRIDRLERDPDGRLVIVDVKTGKTPLSKAKAAAHPQLATYQVAAAEGAVTGEPAGEVGGGRLVFVAKATARSSATERTQPPLADEELERWRSAIHAAAAATRGPTFLAQVGDDCRLCPVRTSCPAQDSGRAVTG